MNTKWTIEVRFVRTSYGSDKEAVEKDRIVYQEFKDRLISTVKYANEKDFDDKDWRYFHVCKDAKEVLEYFYFMNPGRGFTIPDNCKITISNVCDMAVTFDKFNNGRKNSKEGLGYGHKNRKEKA